MRSLVAIVLLAGLARAEPEVSFKPPSKIAKAQDRFVHGKQLFEAKQYPGAALEFAAAYELDPDAKFLLFNVAIARRMAGACKEAIDAYREFLDAGPPDALAKNARIGIERCETVLAAQPPKVTPPVDQPIVDAPVVEPSVETKPDVTPPVAPPHVDQPITHDASVEARWYRDRLGVALVGAGAASALAGATFYLLARRDADATFTPTSVGDYLDNRRSASQLQTAGWIASGIAAALVAGGVIRYATRSTGRTVVVGPASSRGAVLLLEGRF